MTSFGIESRRARGIAQALNSCAVVDKDQTATQIGQAIMAMNEVYKLTGVPRRSRTENLQKLERGLNEMDPVKQPDAAKQVLARATSAVVAVANDPNLEAYVPSMRR